jgi:hypothetical protein
VSARTQKSRFKDLEWSSVTAMSSKLLKSHIGVQTDLAKKEKEKEKEKESSWEWTRSFGHFV